jgi:hypothetical protein
VGRAGSAARRDAPAESAPRDDRRMRRTAWGIERSFLRGGQQRLMSSERSGRWRHRGGDRPCTIVSGEAPRPVAARVCVVRRGRVPGQLACVGKEGSLGTRSRGLCAGVRRGRVAGVRGVDSDAATIAAAHTTGQWPNVPAYGFFLQSGDHAAGGARELMHQALFGLPALGLDGHKGGEVAWNSVGLVDGRNGCPANVEACECRARSARRARGLSSRRARSGRSELRDVRGRVLSQARRRPRPPRRPAWMDPRPRTALASSRGQERSNAALPRDRINGCSCDCAGGVRSGLEGGDVSVFGRAASELRRARLSRSFSFGCARVPRRCGVACGARAFRSDIAARARREIVGGPRSATGTRSRRGPRSRARSMTVVV